MPFVYVPVTIGIYRDDVRLVDFDCEARVEYELPDGPSGVLDWDVTRFYLEAKYKGKSVHIDIGQKDPLWADLYSHMDCEWIHDQAREILAADGICSLYLDPDL